MYYRGVAYRRRFWQDVAKTAAVLALTGLVAYYGLKCVTHFSQLRAGTVTQMTFF
jgi:hypothetical protein